MFLSCIWIYFQKFGVHIRPLYFFLLSLIEYWHAKVQASEHTNLSILQFFQYDVTPKFLVCFLVRYTISNVLLVLRFSYRHYFYQYSLLICCFYSFLQTYTLEILLVLLNSTCTIWLKKLHYHSRQVDYDS